MIIKNTTIRYNKTNYKKRKDLYNDDIGFEVNNIHTNYIKPICHFLTIGIKIRITYNEE